MSERTLPHNLDAEKSVLGAILVNNDAFARAAVKAEDFFRRAHGQIYAAMLRLDQRKSPLDFITLTNELARAATLDDCGGRAYISALADGVPRTSNIEHYASIVREKARLRELIGLASMILEDAYADAATAADIIKTADCGIVDMQRTGPSRLVDLRSTTGDVYAELEYSVEHKGELTGTDTGFASINDVTYGWQPSDLVVIAARPSMGKTALTLNMAIAAARTGKPVAIFSLEMRTRQIRKRLLSILSGVALTRIKNGYLGEPDYERLTVAVESLGTLPIFIDDRSGQTVADIRSACRRTRAEHGIGLIIVDYLQLMPGSLDRRGATRNEEMTDISRRLKGLAEEVSAPLIALSQLSRAGSDRNDKRPLLTDLRESGALEQDADIVAFLHRKHHRESGLTYFIMEKQRDGDGGTMNLTLDRDIQTFVDGGEEPPKPEKSASESKARPPRRLIPSGTD